MSKSTFNPKWLKTFVKQVYTFRYAVSLLFIAIIIGLWFFLYFGRNWDAKEATQVCTGFLLVLTIFFAALNYEFSASKFKADLESARHLLTFNAAMDYQKAPMQEYWKTLTKHESELAEFLNIENPSGEDFHNWLKKKENLEIRIAVVGLLNYLESLCCAIDKGLIDREFIQAFFGAMFKSYYKEYYFYIKYRQDKGTATYGKSNAWVSFSSFVQELK